MITAFGTLAVVAEEQPDPAPDDSSAVVVDDSTTTSTQLTEVTASPSVSTVIPPSTTAAFGSGRPTTDAALQVLDELSRTDSSDSTVLDELVDRLTSLAGDPDPTRPQYDRDAFSERADLDGDCLDSRHEVLLAEALSPTMSGNGCTVIAGDWYDPYTDEWFVDPADLQLDHVVSLGDAWRSGAWLWSDSDRELFSNHPANLNVVAGAENQRKADDGPASYSPANERQRCAYLVQYGAVKAAWGLTITRQDLDALVAGITACTTFESAAPAALPPPPPTTTSTTTTTTTTTAPPTTSAAIQPFVPPTTAAQPNCHPSYTPCVPNASDVDCLGGSGNGPEYTGRVTVIGPDVYDLDRDGNGIGCEN